MGQELECRLRLGRRVLAGKAMLESDYLLFRGEERLKLAFKDLHKVAASAGLLELDYEGGHAALELGTAAEKWAAKILNPPTRAAKLGLKPDLSYRVAGDLDANFLDELALLKKAAPRARADLVFLSAPTRRQLEVIPKLAFAMESAGALWVIYPKGIDAIREIDVLQAGRSAGLKDVKVASFSPTHTALKFVIPVNARPK